MNTTKKEVKVGLIGVGLNTYWNQFEGLLSRLTDYQRMIKERMSGLQATVIDGGMVDSPEKAARTAEVLKSEDIEILFIFISTYALSSTILPIAQRIKIPVILLNIQPVAAINYDYINGLGDRGKMTGEWLAHCQACSTCRHQIRHPDRLPRRTIRMERNRKLDRCGKGRTRDA